MLLIGRILLVEKEEKARKHKREEEEKRVVNFQIIQMMQTVVGVLHRTVSLLRRDLLVS
jgi:hypothetical protein